MKKIGKLFSLATAIATLIALSSCGQKNSESKTVNAEPQAEYSLNAADISLENEFSDILCLDSYSNTIFVFGMLADGSYGGYTSNDNLTSFEGFSFKPSDDEAVITSTMLNDTDKAIVTYKDEKTLIHIFDDKGKEKAVNEYSNLFDAEENHVTVLPDQNGFYVNVNNEKVSYADYSGNVSPIKQIGDKDILGITKNKDNKAVILLSGFDGKTTIADLNEDNISNERSCGDKSSAFLSACSGCGDYEIAAVFNDGMYGLKGTDWIKLSDFMDNTFSSYNITNLIMTSDSSFIVSVKNDEKAYLKKLTQRDPSEIAEQKTIKIAALQGGLVSDYYLKEYNSLQSKYKVEFSYYNGENIEDCIRNLKMDIISGNGPDIMPFDVRLPIDTFGANSGVFIDLYSVINDDPDLSRDDFVNGFLEGLETDGKLLMITPSFSISTIECKDKYLNGISDWDYNQMMKILNENKEEISISAKSKYESYTDAFLDIIKYYPYVNYSQASCSFNDDTFIELMEYFKENKIGSKNPVGWDSSMLVDSFKNDEIMLNVTQEQNYLSLYNMVRERFNEPATAIGYPSSNGSISYVEIENGFAILANSDVKEGAWDFIKTEFLSDRYYNGTEGSYIFPAIDKYIDKQLNTLNTNLAKWKKEGENCEPMTDEQIAEYASWVRENAGNIVKRDGNVEEVIRDELNLYFNDECSAEEAIDSIQSRIGLYLSEQYQ